MKTSKMDQINKRHREAIEAAKPRLTLEAPIVNKERILRFKQLAIDKEAYEVSAMANFNFMKRFFANLNGNSITFPFRPTFPYSMPSRLTTIRGDQERIAKENCRFYLRLSKVKSTYQTRDPTHYAKLKSYRKPEKSDDEIEKFALPSSVLERYKDQMEFPPPGRCLWKVMRPRIYFDIDVQGLGYYGRICMELFTEAAPFIVLEFVRACVCRHLQKFTLSYIFSDMFVAGFLSVDNVCDKIFPLEYDDSAVEFNRPGVISFRRKCINGFTNNLINYAMSFEAMPILHEKRIGFGYIFSGLDVLQSLEEFSSRNGIMRKVVTITKCGCYRY